MKYVKSIFAVFLWMFVCCTGTAACAEVMYGAFPLVCEAGEVRTFNVELAGSLNAICIDGERGFLLLDRELWAVDDELNRLKKRHVFDEVLCGMDIRDNVVYFSYLVDGVTRFARLTALWKICLMCRRSGRCFACSWRRRRFLCCGSIRLMSC